jgi:LCCL domain
MAEFENGAPSEGELSNEHIDDAKTILTGLLSELPDDAQELVDKINKEMVRVEEKSAEMIAQIREKAAVAIADFETKAEQRRKALLQHGIEQLEPLQKELFQSGELAKALATFVQIQVFKARLLNVLPDPGNLLAFKDIGRTHYFRVVGDLQGPVWGSDPYTLDSMLRVAAVHAGAVEAGEEGVVRVSIVDMSGVQIRGSTRYGVDTMDWGSYPVGYHVSRS